MEEDREPRRSTQRPRSGRRWLAVLPPLLLGVALGAGGMYGASHRPHTATATAGAPPQKKAPLYHCPMHPAITSDHPGDCPICGMKLLPVAATGTDSTPASERSQPAQGMVPVTIDAARQQLIGLRTAPVTRGAIRDTWRTVARIEVDPTRVRKTNVKVDGFVEQIFVDFVGQSVRKGQPLFSLYSPSLLAAQNEYLLALQTQDTLNPGASRGNLVAAARRRLELWDVPAAELDRLARTREPSKTLTLLSPIAGVVTAKNVVQGARVSPGEAPYEITDLSRVWAMADAYESDVGRIRMGMKAILTVVAYPHRPFAGTVAFIDPLLDPQTRTAKVHLHVANPRRELKPGMYGEVALEGLPQQGLRIAADAVLRAGTQDVVFVARGQGKFEPRVVQLGVKSGDLLEVTGGLAEGEAVVTRANFLIDSESQLRAALAGLEGT
jgi:membrane fusion protein, copper/silver efflux system